MELWENLQSNGVLLVHSSRFNEGNPQSVQTSGELSQYSFVAIHFVVVLRLLKVTL
jgi:hypothetical protein